MSEKRYVYSLYAFASSSVKERQVERCCSNNVYCQKINISLNASEQNVWTECLLEIFSLLD